LKSEKIFNDSLKKFLKKTKNIRILQKNLLKFVEYYDIIKWNLSRVAE